MASLALRGNSQLLLHAHVLNISACVTKKTHVVPFMPDGSYVTSSPESHVPLVLYDLLHLQSQCVRLQLL